MIVIYTSQLSMVKSFDSDTDLAQVNQFLEIFWAGPITNI